MYIHQLNKLFFFVLFGSCIGSVSAMENVDIADCLAQDLENFSFEENSVESAPNEPVNEYDSDSEDEAGYAYHGLPNPEIPDGAANKDCIALMRGIHFSPSKFVRSERSAARRSDDTGKDIYAAAAYDLAGQTINNADNAAGVREQALKVRECIMRLSSEARNTFQEIYTNDYNKFHSKLGTQYKGGIFSAFTSRKNPQVSTGENFLHAIRYASGLKSLGEGVEFLDPEYDVTGKPKHPYLGKLFAVLVPTDQLGELSPYFVVHGHAQNDISVSYHYSNNILEEREVSFPGIIPGDCVILSIPVKVPSFAGEYKQWYQEKFGISRRIYNYRKKIFTTGKYFKDEKKNPEQVKKETAHSLLVNIILPHAAEQLKKHVEQACGAKNITLVYKQLNGNFGSSLPSLQVANAERRRIK